MDIYLIIVIVLVAFAISDLVVGVESSSGMDNHDRSKYRGSLRCNIFQRIDGGSPHWHFSSRPVYIS